ncbi:MAG: thermonuclease family protein [Bacillota bacterium]|nr:thermonuclease family protein [Bacillota bacterium]
MIFLIEGSCIIAENDYPAGIDLAQVRITRVVDGDTAYARFVDGSEEKVRFIGVDAPEISESAGGLEPYGAEATEFTRRQIDGNKIWLEFDVEERDQYDRLLAYLWLDIPEEINESEIRSKMFNSQLLLEGYASQVTFPPNTRYVEYFSQFTAEARNANRGLWSLSGGNNYTRPK